MAGNIAYTEPKICHYNHDLKKQWCVYFTVKNKDTGQEKRMQFRGDINKLTDKRGRLREAGKLVDFWVSKLKTGWHPWQKDAAEKPVYAYTHFCDALDFALSKCKNASGTVTQYGITINLVKVAAEKVGVARKRIADIKKADIKLVMDQMYKDNNLTPTGYNRHLCYLSAVLFQLDEWEVVENNPAHGIKKLKVTETERFVPLTAEEKTIIRDRLPGLHFPFFVYVNILYSTGIRPKEILSLKIRDVNLTTEEITILPDLAAENSKTTNIRRVPIDQHLLVLLKELKLGDYPPDYYIFGSPFIAKTRGNGGTVKEGRGVLHPDFLKPSPKSIARPNLTKLWSKLVVKGLGVKKMLYSLKHSGANDKILAGVDLDALRSMYGHTSKATTLKYATQIKEVHAKEIKQKSPKL